MPKVRGLHCAFWNLTETLLPVYTFKHFPSIYQTSLPSPCRASLSMEDFFKDAPWLNIPSHRQGEITIEPLYQPGRLLGGSPVGQNAPPKSKLAALAASRKKKEIPTSASKETNSSVALLDKLGTKFQTTRIDGQSTQPQEEGIKIVPQSSDLPAKRYPTKKRQVPEPAETQNSDPKKAQPGFEAVVQDTPVVVPAPIACPSNFAQTLLGTSVAVPRSSTASAQCSTFYPAYTQEHTENDPFTGPSPDDVVIKAQTSKGSTPQVR